jgi:hypothetical protein
MIEARIRKGDIYNLILEVPEREYFQIYEDLGSEAAEDILQQYLVYHGDDGRYSDVEIQYNKNTHIVSIHADLRYDDNDHTEMPYLPPHLIDKI